ncbi:ribonuclease inhibitor-like [Triplophysa dalaica]|uniref:ribonuclease inhibitor-like n=1 Tax=Triplophysa dalaica TaxID=1582913 RepID=UPI0024DFC47A|nr:ribonuclease inhibitor-like [Triplophysa dalaica]
MVVSECSIGEEGYKCLCSAVRSNPESHLIELDLRGNDPGETGVKLIFQLIQDHKCKLNTVRFLSSSSAVKAFEYLTETLGINPLLQREVNLSDHKLDESRVNQICDLLKDKHCHINTLILRDCGLTEESCSALASVLSSNISVKELDMSNNHLQDSGVKKLQTGLENIHCQLQKLSVSECSIGEEGYKCLYSAVRSNPESHLIELDLRGNDPGETGVKLIYQLIQDHKCKLNTVRLLSSSSAVKAFEYLTETFGINPLLQREVNLSDHKLDESRVNQICDLLKDKHCHINTLILSECSIGEEGYKCLYSAVRSNPESHLIELDLRGNDPGETGVKLIYQLIQDHKCKLNTVRLRDCGLTEESCSALASVLSSNISVKELDMSNNHLQDSGVKRLSDGLKNNCKLHKLSVSECSIGEEGYKCLYSAVRSNPESHLIELDLRGNDPGETGVKLIYQLLQNSKYALETVRFLKSDVALRAFEYLHIDFGVNSSLQREVNLSHNIRINISTVKQIFYLLEDKPSKLNKLMLDQCGLTDECLRSNPSRLRHLNLSGNKLGDSGVGFLCFLLGNCPFKPGTIELCGCSITESQCIRLISALCLNLTRLKHLNFSQNKLGDSGIKSLCDLLKHSDCKLDQLELRACGLTDEGLVALTSALNSNPSHLRKLDLSVNPLRDSGVEHLCALLSNSQFSLETLDLCECSITKTQLDKMISALCSNPSHLGELNLSGNEIKDTGVKLLCRLLEHSRCKLEKLSLNKCNITYVTSLADTLAQTRALRFLRDLDLSHNNIKDLKKLHEVLKGSGCKLSLENQGSFTALFKFPVAWTGGDKSSDD